jgi:hypothetical protein
MKPVVQLERTGCGIASVAALAGVSYAKAKRVANRLGIFADDPKLWSETDYIRRLLKEYGIRSASPELPVTSWKALPDIALLAVKWHKEGDRAFWHWVVFWRGAFRDCRARLEPRAANSNSDRLRSHETQVVHRYRGLYT